MTTEKVSVAIGREELRLAKRAAREAGLSLSAFFTEAVRARLLERQRRMAAAELLSTFDPQDFPTAERAQELLTLWTAPPAVRAKKAASKRR